jgi:hypothetical protein
LDVIFGAKVALECTSDGRFQKIYSFTATQFPLGISMRFIPHVLRVNSNKVAKIIISFKTS